MTEQHDWTRPTSSPSPSASAPATDPRTKLGVPSPTDPISGETKPSTKVDQQDLCIHAMTLERCDRGCTMTVRERKEMDLAHAIVASSDVCKPYGSREGCGAHIIWAANASTQKRMPLDQTPVNEGVRFTLTHVGRNKLIAKATKDGDGYQSHFATCPHANQHRGGKR